MVTDLAKSQMFTVRLSDLTLINVEPANLPGQIGAEPARPIAQGSVIDKKYRIIKLLGQGGMGAVYQAQHLQLGRDVALKTFASHVYSEDSQKRFLREAQSLAKLEHKNVVNVFDYGWQDDKTPYYTMEYLIGWSLAEKIADQGRLAEVEETINLFIEIAAGLAYVHSKNLIHRDLKPGNIFLTRDGAKIVDFGIVSTMDQDLGKDQRLTGTNDDIILGSPLYMSPEQASGRPIDKRSDIYSFGCTLYECLTGSPPFMGDNALQTLLKHQSERPKSLREKSDREFSPQLELLMKRLLAKKPEDRFIDFDEVEASLRRCLQTNTPSKISTTRTTTRTTKTETKKSVAPEKLFEYDPKQEDELSAHDVPKKFTLAASIAIVAGALCLASMGLFYWQSQKEAQLDRHIKGPETSDLDRTINKKSPKDEAPAPEYKLDPIVTKTYKDDNGTSMLMVEFPTRQEAGKFAIGLKGRTQKAAGQFRWPASKQIYFEPSAFFCEDPTNFRMLKPLNVTALHLNKGADVIRGGELLKELIQSVPNLSVLNISSSQLTDEDLVQLDKFANLTSLSVAKTDVTGQAVANLKRLKDIWSLDISMDKNPRPVLTKLTGNSAMRKLIIYGVPLEPLDYKLIAAQAGTRELTCSGSNLSDDNLKILAEGKIPLRWMDCERSFVTIKSLPTWIAMKKKGLQMLRLSSTNLSKEQCRTMKEALLPMASLKIDPDNLEKNAVNEFLRKDYRY